MDHFYSWLAREQGWRTEDLDAATPAAEHEAVPFEHPGIDPHGEIVGKGEGGDPADSSWR